MVLYRNVSENEIDWMLAFANKILPDFVPTREKTVYWYKRNPETYFVVTKNDKELIGVFVVSPISNTATRLMMESKLLGASLDREHILQTHEKPAGYYIGSILSDGFRNKYHTMKCFQDFLRVKLSETKEGTLVFLTNPVTKDGVRLIQKYGFRAVDSEGKIGETIFFKEYKG